MLGSGLIQQKESQQTYLTANIWIKKKKKKHNNINDGSVPAVTVSQHEHYQEPETEASKGNLATDLYCVI